MTGPPEVLVVTRGHAFDRNAFSEMLGSLESVACTQVEQPAAQHHFGREQAERWNAFLMYDMPGYEFQADHSEPVLLDPPEAFQADLLETVERGHGFVFLHHALGGWPTWDAYADLMGGRFRFVRDETAPDSGYRHAVRQRISTAVAGHPVVAGLEDGFEIEDELYLAEIFTEGIQPLLVTDAELTDRTLWSTYNAARGRRDTNDGWNHPQGSGVVAWVRDHPTSRIVYIQFGDAPSAYANPSFRRLLDNALSWVSDRTQTA